MAFCAKKSDYISATYDCYSKIHSFNFSSNKFSICLISLKNSKCYLASSGSTIYQSIHKTVPQPRTFDHVTILHQLICSFQIFYFLYHFSKLIRNLFSHGTKGKILSYQDFSRVILSSTPWSFYRLFSLNTNSRAALAIGFVSLSKL